MILYWVQFFIKEYSNFFPPFQVQKWSTPSRNLRRNAMSGLYCIHVYSWCNSEKDGVTKCAYCIRQAKLRPQNLTFPAKNGKIWDFRFFSLCVYQKIIIKQKKIECVSLSKPTETPRSFTKKKKYYTAFQIGKKKKKKKERVLEVLKILLLHFCTVGLNRLVQSFL